MLAVITRNVLIVIIITLSVNGTNEKSRDTYTAPANNDYLQEIYTTSWAVNIVEGGKKMADAVAKRYGFNNLGDIAGVEDVYHFELRGWEKLRVRTDSPYTYKSKQLLLEPCIGFAEQQVIRPRIAKSYTIPTDPLFQSQWNLLNTGQHGNVYRGRDLNVERAWLQGLSGCNVTVVVVDDGLDYTHRDLWENYVPQVSYDFLEDDNDPASNGPWHGTNCGGIIGSEHDNKICGVGIAYNSNLGGVAVLGSNSDLNEAKSLTLKNSIVDIYSNSWGPFDSGDIVDGPGPVTKRALKNGIREGRDGKGSIFVWANGNGGRRSDDCAADGYASSIYTISIGAVSVNGTPSPFDERCSAKMTVTYVTNLSGESEVSTTALNGKCTTSFGGTSAATPMAAGLIALALEANTNLTWRDIQYLVAYTANPLLTDVSMYTKNGAGLLVSHQFGFGVMDAEALVTRARHWVNVPLQIEENLFPSTTRGRSTSMAPFATNVNYSGSIHYLEHIVVQMSVEVGDHSQSKRGDIEIVLESPFRTLSKLLSQRTYDYKSGGYYEWPFMSVMFWGENPHGQWNLTVYSLSGFTTIDVTNIRFYFFGTSNVPEAVTSIPDVCHQNCARGCAKDGPDYCDSCTNLRNAYTLECIDVCLPGYSERNGYCFSPNLPTEECNSPLKFKEQGSCVESGFNGCCSDENCEVVVDTSPLSCYCDALCHIYDDCCEDILLIGCYHNDTTKTVAIPYIELWVTDGVETLSVEPRDDDISSPINVEFPFGFQLQSTIFVGTNGYFTFEEYTGYTPFLFDSRRNESLVAPFFSDIDISSGVGEINYEVHTEFTSKHLLSQVDSVISEHAHTNFTGKWMIVAEWDGVPQYGGDPNITNTFQGILTTDFARSYAVFIYGCGDLGFSNRVTIGFVTDDGLFANHESILRGNAKVIGCLNMPATPWVNVVFEVALSENECDVDNGGCEHICSDTFSSFECSCKNGYFLDTDGFTCRDINECSSRTHGCSHICVNDVGSYTCECRKDYTLDSNGKSCSTSCGGILNGANGTFHTPDWPLSYPSLDFRCEWIIDIESLTNAVIEITFNEMYGIHGRDPCRTDYVQVLDGIEQNSSSLGKYCFLDAPVPIVTSSPRATVVFQASSNRHPPSRVGVSLSYRSILKVNECEHNNGGCEHGCLDTHSSFQCFCDVGYELDTDGRGCIDVDECSTGGHECEDICINTDGSYTCHCRQGYELDGDGHSCVLSCGGRLTASSGSFHTPDWPQSYPSLDFRCEWLIEIQNFTSAVIEIEFNDIYGIHGREPCSTDYVQILDGIGQNSSSLGKYCFLHAPDPIITSSPRATVVFQASSNRHLPSRVGVSISYRLIFTVNECETDNGGCEHKCEDTFSSYQCSCEFGYALDVDSRGCIDVDECTTGEHDCEDICDNTHGSYTCSCRLGYSLDDNGQSCSLSCGGILTEANGTFHTPDWPLSYPSLDFRCVWSIDLANITDAVIEISFDDEYGIHGRDPCATDYVQVLDGLEQDSTSLGKYCFTRAPEPIVTSSNTATVIFQASTSHHLSSRVGASVSYAMKPIVNECNNSNGGCAHTCSDTLHSYVCSCNDGYIIDQDGHNCIDIDECSTDHVCEQICVNNDGSYTCECRDGYSLDRNGKNCSISCGGVLSNTSGYFQTPDWPHGYPQEDFICEWTIDIQDQGSIRFVVDSSAYGINGRPPCPEDHIEYFEGLGEESRSLGRYCKLHVPDPITVPSGTARIVFEGKRNPSRPASRKGVQVTYEVAN